MALFRKNKNQNNIRINPIRPESYSKRRKQIPDGATITCRYCQKVLVKSDLPEDYTCKYCQGHLQFPAFKRIDWLIDEGTFEESHSYFQEKDPLDFPKYRDKLRQIQTDTGLNEAIVTGFGKLADTDVAIGVMDSRFIMASMGSIVGEKLVLLFDEAAERKVPVILFIASGGARMQEGIFSLMQMAKVTQAVSRHHKAGLFYVSVLTQPTTGGVTASFANQADVILAEPKAIIGFAGRRVIEQTIRAELPPGFQEAETVLENGFVDAIVPRNEQMTVLSQLIKIHQ